MANYINYFNKRTDYETFKNTEGFITPNVSFIEENQTLYYIGLDGKSFETKADGKTNKIKDIKIK